MTRSSLITKQWATPYLGRFCLNLGTGAYIHGFMRIGHDVTVSAYAVITFDVPDGTNMVSQRPRTSFTYPQAWKLLRMHKE